MIYREFHGFYQNSRFRWTFNSHNGFFIPIQHNMKLIGLRIHLDDIYNTDTTDIWFSSNAKYNGTKATNNIMVLKSNFLELHELNIKKEKKDIIIATDMLLAYKIRTRFSNMTVIGIPNVISKFQTQKLYSKDEINKIYLVMDQHTILHSSESVLKNLINKYGEEKIELHTSICECYIPDEILKSFNSNQDLIQYSA